MSRNKKTVERYLDGFRAGERERILSCLTEDVRWTVFGAYRQRTAGLRGATAHDDYR